MDNHRWYRVLTFFLVLLTTVVIRLPINAQNATNLVDGCVQTFDEQIDYFPEKVTLTHAQGFSVEYHNNYKVVTITTPWRDAKAGFQYVLVQCGTPAPEGFEKAAVIEVPVKSVIMMSTTYLPYLEPLGILDRLVGVDDFTYISTPAVRQLIKENKLKAIGSGSTVNVEAAIDLAPNLIMTYGSGSSEYDSHPKLLEAGLKVVINAEYMDTTPLGTTEWLKFMAVFFNREGAAEKVFSETATNYDRLATLVQTATTKPTVFTNMPYQGTWYMPGGQSYVATILADAGAKYLWEDDKTTGSIPLAFEIVFERAAAADYWLNIGFVSDLDALIKTDARFADFRAFQLGNVWNNDRWTNENGGNDYYEQGVARPDLVLADLIAIFHPELMADHQFIFYRQLK
jgi:iron complex transport system substrate-binding protein